MRAGRWNVPDVEVRLGVPVTHVDAGGVTIGDERIEAATVLWCAGVQGVPVARTLGTNVKPNGTVAVRHDFSVPGHPECFVAGDAAHVIGPDGRPVPGLASVAQHQGRYVGELIAARLADGAPPSPPGPFVPSQARDGHSARRYRRIWWSFDHRLSRMADVGAAAS